MKKEEKQALIDYCKSRITEMAPYAKQRKVMEIALAALTAQPVKQPKNTGPGYASVALSTRDEQWYEAIRAAGYEVQE